MTLHLHSNSGTPVGLLTNHASSFHGWKTEEASQSFLPNNRWWESANLDAYEMEKAPRHGEAEIPTQRNTPAGNTMCIGGG